MSEASQEAKALLVHYFRATWKSKWERDNTIEVQAIVDLIVEAAVQEVRDKEKSHRCDSFLDEALNSGNGGYKP